MKTLLKKLSSVVLALAVICSLAPAAGSVILADEAETEAPAAAAETEPEKKDSGNKDEDKSKDRKPEETEKVKEEPKETEKAEPEAPKSTEKAEPDEPKETEKPEHEQPEETRKADAESPKVTENSDTDTPKESDKTISDKPKDFKKIKIGKITGIKVTDGTLTWDKFNGTYNYDYRISKSCLLGDEDLILTTNSVSNINDHIDKLIKSGEIEKKSPYKIEIFAYDSNDMQIAYGSYDYPYSPKTNPPSLNSFQARIDTKTGTLKWSWTADAYVLYIDGVCWGNAADDVPSFHLPSAIDQLIESGLLEKSKNKSYSIKLVAQKYEYDDEDPDGNTIPVAKWTGSYNYTSKAGPATLYAFEKGDVWIANGLLKWKPVPGATSYDVIIGDDEGQGCTCENIKQRVFDLNATISELINEGGIKTGTTEVGLVAYHNETAIASSTLKYNLKKVTDNLSSVKGRTVKIKYKKLKKRSQYFVASKVINGVSIPGSESKYIFQKLKGSKKISIDSYSGAILIKKKGLKKKKTYKVKVKVKISNDAKYGYTPKEKTITIKFKVK